MVGREGQGERELPAVPQLRTKRERGRDLMLDDSAPRPAQGDRVGRERARLEWVEHVAHAHLREEIRRLPKLGPYEHDAVIGPACNVKPIEMEGS